MNYIVEIRCETCGATVSSVRYSGDDLYVAETAIHEAEGHAAPTFAVEQWRPPFVERFLEQQKAKIADLARAARENIARLVDERAKIRADLEQSIENAKKKKRDAGEETR